MNDFDKRSTERGQKPSLYPDGGNGRNADPVEKLEVVRARYQAVAKLLRDKAISMSAASEFLKEASEEIFQALGRELE